MQAVAALAGYELRETTDARGVPAYAITKWNLARVLPDLGAVEAFLERIAGPGRGS